MPSVLRCLSLCLFCVITSPLRAEGPAGSPPAPEVSAAQQLAWERWVAMLDRISPDLRTYQRAVDADLASADEFARLCALGGVNDPDECAAEAGAYTLGEAIWGWHAYFAVLGQPASLQWLSRAADRPSSRLLARHLQLALGQLQPIDLLRELHDWPEARERAHSLRMLAALPLDASVLPAVESLQSDPDPAVRVAALALRAALGVPDHAAELAVIRECPGCAHLPRGKGPWTLLAQEWPSLSASARPKAIVWAQWPPEAIAWAQTTLPGWTPAEVWALMSVLLFPGAPPTSDGMRIRDAWLQAVAAADTDPAGLEGGQPQPAMRMALRRMLGTFDLSSVEDRKVLQALTRHHNEVLAMAAAGHLAIEDRRQVQVDVVRRFHGAGALPDWVLAEFGSLPPPELAPQLLATVLQSGPEQVCRAMSIGADVLVQHEDQGLEKAVADAIGRFLAAAPIAPDEWDRVLADVQGDKREGPGSGLSGAACLIADGAWSWRLHRGAIPAAWLAAIRGHTDVEAALVRLWLLGPGEDATFREVRGVLRSSGIAALAREAERIAEAGHPAD